MPRNIQHFLWKYCREILPTGFALYRKKVVSEPSCPVCGGDSESIVHMFCDCPLARQVWINSSVNVDFGLSCFNSFVGLWDFLVLHWQHAPNKDWLLFSSIVIMAGNE